MKPATIKAIDEIRAHFQALVDMGITESGLPSPFHDKSRADLAFFVSLATAEKELIVFVLDHEDAPHPNEKRPGPDYTWDPEIRAWFREKAPEPTEAEAAR